MKAAGNIDPAEGEDSQGSIKTKEVIYKMTLSLSLLSDPKPLSLFSLIRLLNVLNIGYSSIFFVVFLDPFCFVFVEEIYKMTVSLSRCLVTFFFDHIRLSHSK